ncbi:MAG TPA: hypothetical protein VIL72_06795 [Beijerinckiaceae bacterium]
MTRLRARNLACGGALALAATLSAGDAARADHGNGLAGHPSPPPAAAERAATPPPEVEYATLAGGWPAFIWRPAPGAPRKRVALAPIHLSDPGLSYLACAEMARRGYVAVCAPPAPERPLRSAYETQATQLRGAVARARAEPGVSAVAIIGHGAGGAAAAFYQNVAANGPTACQGPEKLSPCDGARLADLPAADALVLLDPDLGQAYGLLSQLDPAVTDENAPTRRDPALDMYDPRNGFDPGRNAGDYSAAFRRTFHEGQHARNARLIDEARRRITAVTARDPDAYPDDMPFFIPGAQAARLWQADTSLLSRTKRAHKLLAADGSTPVRKLSPLAPPAGNQREATSFRGALQLTVKQFLAGYALQTLPDYDVTADDLIGVAWDSSTTSTIANVAGVTAPTLVMTMTGHIYVRPAEMILDASAATDKELVAVEGASYAIWPCAACAGAPGRFGDTVRRTFDYMDAWLDQRV